MRPYDAELLLKDCTSDNELHRSCFELFPNVPDVGIIFCLNRRICQGFRIATYKKKCKKDNANGFSCCAFTQNTIVFFLFFLIQYFEMSLRHCGILIILNLDYDVFVILQMTAQCNFFHTLCKFLSVS